jgi:hypothetical protein
MRVISQILVTTSTPDFFQVSLAVIQTQIGFPMNDYKGLMPWQLIELLPHGMLVVTTIIFPLVASGSGLL